jgi:SAM-dependent methyltransferase
MEHIEYVRMAALQDRHWWFQAKRRLVGAVIDRLLASSGDKSTDRLGVGRSLDAGCGTGSMAGVLPGRTVGVDGFLPALAHVRGELVVNADLLSLPFADDSFDVVGCFDVLYHRRVADVAEAIGGLRRVLRPGGLLVVTDAAGPSLMGPHDIAFHGARRFTLGDLSSLLARSGLRVRHATYFHAALLPVAAPIRWAARVRHRISGDNRRPEPDQGRSDLAPAPAWLDRALSTVSRIERAVAVRHRLPFGLSVLVAAEKEG